MQPLVNTCMTPLSEGSDAFDDLSPLFVINVAQVTPQSFDNEEKGKKIVKLSYDITMLKATPRGYSLIEVIQL